ncbi:uncharacterized protein LOC133038444 [Cannabis sativa]|uniref:uncharacterized protein LOC133038444 n=1 Tax=Cannabis sativa TaxID=3483 RepID=UPI0029C9D792|nr:uncharacterized protein LOC133038444 [Cannabis sativa]
MFSEEESRRILSIQFSDCANTDSWFWSEEKSGLYSVSSAYKMLQQQSGAWPVTGAETCWQNLWQLQVPAKVQHLVWRAMSGCLPTKDVVEEAAMVAWRIWLARNDILWNNKSTKALDVVKLARTNLVSWRNAQKQKSEPLLNVNYSKDLEHWRKPIVHKYKINVDGAIFEAENCFGVGIVIRDQAGHLVEAVSTSKVGVVTPKIDEVIGVKEALSWIKNHNLSDVEIETDSLVVVQAINGEVQMPS